jgi:hypothetical protein
VNRLSPSYYSSADPSSLDSVVRGPSAGRSGHCCDYLLEVIGPSGLAPIRSYVDLLHWSSLPGPQGDDLTNYGALGPFVRSFILLVDPGDICPPQPEPPVWATLVCGAECHAQRSAALAHLSARAKSVVIVSTSCVANFSNIFSSRTPWWKAVMMEASEIRGIVPRSLVKREMNVRRVYPGFCLTAWRWASTPCC